jgi:hypothetical protein
MNINKTLSALSIVSMSLTLGTASTFADDMIPYPGGGPNPISYTFTATAPGNITAYFAGSAASYDNELTMMVNGVLTGIVGLDNQTSTVGDSLVLGTVNAGDTIVFAMINHSLFDAVAYSDPSLNVAYDLNGTAGHNHIYSTAYTSTPAIDSIPNGTYVAFEDLRFPNSDFNYFDETFVFSNVSVVASPDAASTLLLLAGGFGIIALARSRFLGRTLAV